MTLDCIATGSNGNCYILKDTNGRAVILDCGIRFQDITHHKAFPNFFNIDFVFVSHSHSDHNKSLNDFKNGVLTLFIPSFLEHSLKNFSSSIN